MGNNIDRLVLSAVILGTLALVPSVVGFAFWKAENLNDAERAILYQQAAARSSTAQETIQEYQEANLPPGCDISLLPSLGNFSRIVMVRCKAEDATTTTTERDNLIGTGRVFVQTTDSNATITIEGRNDAKQ